jgi:hypothetical protein
MGADPRRGRWRSHAGRLAIVGLATLGAGCKSETTVQEQVVRPVKVAVIAAVSIGVQSRPT